MDERIQKYEEKMKKTLASLESELVTIRAGRANPHILDKLAVDYYGAPTPLQQVANITVPEARMIQIQPWESSLIKGIEKAILTSDLGLNPSNDGKVIRLVFPELTEERRKELVKDVKKKGEAAKVAVRKFVVMQMMHLRNLQNRMYLRMKSKNLRRKSRRAQINISKKLMRQWMQRAKKS